MTEGESQSNSFVLLGTWLREEAAKPLYQFSFWAYFIFAVVAFGGIGFWVELIRFLRGGTSTEPMFTAVYTYFPAIAFASSMQLIIRDNERRYVRTFGLATGTILLVVALFHAVGILERGWAVLGSVVATVLALALWWIANAGDANLCDVDPKNPLGGGTERPVGGSTAGYRT